MEYENFSKTTETNALTENSLGGGRVGLGGETPEFETPAYAERRPKWIPLPAPSTLRTFGFSSPLRRRCLATHDPGLSRRAVAYGVLMFILYHTSPRRGLTGRTGT